jgi:3-oxoadipate enol-lactonase
VLVGCSFGGSVTVQCVLDHPGLAAALVLVGPMLLGLPPSEHFKTRGGRGEPALDAPDAEQIAYWSEIDPWFVAPANSAARTRLRELLTANPQNLSPPMELERIPERPALPRLGEITVPTLIVAGEQDIPDVHAHCGAIEAAVPHAKRVVLPGSGHLPQLEIADVFNRVLLEFLAPLRLGPLRVGEDVGTTRMQR